MKINSFSKIFYLPCFKRKQKKFVKNIHGFVAYYVLIKYHYADELITKIDICKMNYLLQY